MNNNNKYILKKMLIFSLKAYLSKVMIKKQMRSKAIEMKNVRKMCNIQIFIKRKEKNIIK